MIIQLGCDRCYVQESVCCDQMEVIRISSDAAQSQRKVVKSVWCFSCKVFPLQDRKTLIFKTLLHWIFDLTKYPSQPCIWWAAGQASYSTLIFECSWPSNLKSFYLSYPVRNWLPSSGRSLFAYSNSHADWMNSSPLFWQLILFLYSRTHIFACNMESRYNRDIFCWYRAHWYLDWQCCKVMGNALL